MNDHNEDSRSQEMEVQDPINPFSQKPILDQELGNNDGAVDY
jgi:hypothetical protein